MEIYKITCKINNKIYIGSTKFTKEKRWGDLSSSSSHLSRVRDGIDSPLCNDIRKYGVENFILETLEEVKENRHYAYEREAYWIKYFWDKLGENMIYNQFNGSHGNKNWSVPHNKECQKKAAQKRKEKYGSVNAMMITPEALQKAKETKIKKYGTIAPIISKEKRIMHNIKISNKFLDNVKGDVVVGYKGIFERLNSENYSLTYWQVRRLIEGKYCKKTLIKYPKLENRFILLNNYSNR